MGLLKILCAFKMFIQDKHFKIMLRHEDRKSKFSFIEIPKEKKYFESPITAILGLVLIFLVMSVFFYLTSHKDFIIKVAVFAFIFGLYKIFLAFAKPILALNENGIELRAISLPWRAIRTIELQWKSKVLYLTLNLKNGKVVKEKVENLSFQKDYIFLENIIRSFRKKHRKEFIFKK